MFRTGLKPNFRTKLTQTTTFTLDVKKNDWKHSDYSQKSPYHLVPINTSVPSCEYIKFSMQYLGAHDSEKFISSLRMSEHSIGSAGLLSGIQTRWLVEETVTSLRTNTRQSVCWPQQFSDGHRNERIGHQKLLSSSRKTFLPYSHQNHRRTVQTAKWRCHPNGGFLRNEFYSQKRSESRARKNESHDVQSQRRYRLPKEANRWKEKRKKKNDPIKGINYPNNIHSTFHTTGREMHCCKTPVSSNNNVLGYFTGLLHVYSIYISVSMARFPTFSLENGHRWHYF